MKMVNMSYCRFQNTLHDLQDCSEHLWDDLSEDEAAARADLVALCLEITRGVETARDDDDLVQAEYERLRAWLAEMHPGRRRNNEQRQESNHYRKRLAVSTTAEAERDTELERLRTAIRVAAVEISLLEIVYPGEEAMRRMCCDMLAAILKEPKP